jgi:hypothetical protein
VRSVGSTTFHFVALDSSPQRSPTGVHNAIYLLWEFVSVRRWEQSDRGSTAKDVYDHSTHSFPSSRTSQQLLFTTTKLGVFAELYNLRPFHLTYPSKISTIDIFRNSPQCFPITDQLPNFGSLEFVREVRLIVSRMRITLTVQQKPYLDRPSFCPFSLYRRLHPHTRR